MNKMYIMYEFEEGTLHLTLQTIRKYRTRKICRY